MLLTNAIRFFTFKQQSSLLLLLLLFALSGCGAKVKGPERFQVTGTVTFDGKPVPAGEIIFAPDTAAGNNGPGSLAEIEDGKYTTTFGKGVVGGAYILRVSGSDGVSTDDLPSGKSLFSGYEVKHDFPKKDSTFDIEAPAKSKKK